MINLGTLEIKQITNNFNQPNYLQIGCYAPEKFYTPWRSDLWYSFDGMRSMIPRIPMHHLKSKFRVQSPQSYQMFITPVCRRLLIDTRVTLDKLIENLPHSSYREQLINFNYYYHLWTYTMSVTDFNYMLHLMSPSYDVFEPRIIKDMKRRISLSITNMRLLTILNTMDNISKSVNISRKCPNYKDKFAKYLPLHSNDRLLISLRSLPVISEHDFLLIYGIELIRYLDCRYDLYMLASHKLKTIIRRKYPKDDTIQKLKPQFGFEPTQSSYFDKLYRFALGFIVSYVFVTLFLHVLAIFLVYLDVYHTASCEVRFDIFQPQSGIEAEMGYTPNDPTPNQASTTVNAGFVDDVTSNTVTAYSRQITNQVSFAELNAQLKFGNGGNSFFRCINNTPKK